DAAGNVFVTDGDVIKMIAAGTNAVSTIAGQAGANGLLNGPGATALFWSPIGLTIDAGGNLYVADFANGVIRKIAAGTHDVTTYAGTGVLGTADGPAASATFTEPRYLAIDPNGNVLVADEMARN